MRKRGPKITKEMAAEIHEMLKTKQRIDVANELGINKKQLDNFMIRERYLAKKKGLTPIEVKSIAPNVVAEGSQGRTLILITSDENLIKTIKALL